MEKYQTIVPNNINKTFLIIGQNFQKLRNFYYYCCYSITKSRCDHSIDQGLYINSTKLSCDYPKTNSSEELFFELKKHSRVFDSFVDGPVIFFESSNSNVSKLNILKNTQNHDIVMTALLTFMCAIFMLLSIVYCILRRRISK